MSNHQEIQSVRPSNKPLPEQLETSETHNGKRHKELVEKVHDAEQNAAPQRAAHAARKTATNDPKYGKK